MMHQMTVNQKGVPIGALVQRYGCRPVSFVGTLIGTLGLSLCYLLVGIPYLCVTFGIMTGISSTLLFVSTSVSVQRYFDRNRTLATGFGMVGISVGGLVSAPVNNMLLKKYGLSGTFVIIAGIWLQNLVFTAFYRPLRVKKHKKNESLTLENKKMMNGEVRKTQSKNEVCLGLLKDMVNFSVLKNIQLVLLVIGTVVMNIGAMGFYGHYLNRLTYAGVERETAITFQTVMLISTGTGRVIFMIVGNHRKADRVLMYGVLGIMSSIVITTFGFVMATVTFGVYSVLHGLCAGGFFSIQGAVLVDVAGVTQIAKVTGMFHMGIAFGLLMAVPLTGFIYDVTGRYDVPYFVVGTIALCGSITLLILAVLRRTFWSKSSTSN